MALAPGSAPVRFGRHLRREVREILRVGLPIGGHFAMEVGLFNATGVVMGLFGADALGAHQLAINFASLTFMVPLGIAQAAVVRVALHLGAGVAAAAVRAGRSAIALAAIFMLAMSALMVAAPLTIIGLYLNLADRANSGVVPIAVSLILIAALFQVLDGVQVVAVGALRGYRDTAVPMLIAAFGYWIVGFTSGWILAFPLGLGPVGLWWGLLLGLAVVTVLLLLRLETRSRAHLGLGPATAPQPAPG